MAQRGPISTRRYINTPTPLVDSLSNLGYGGMNTDDSDDTVLPTQFKILENVDITKNGVIRPRRGYTAKDVIVDDLGTKEFKLLGMEEDTLTGLTKFYGSLNGDLFQYFNGFTNVYNWEDIIQPTVSAYGKDWQTATIDYSLKSKPTNLNIINNQYFYYNEKIYSLISNSNNFLMEFDSKKSNPNFVNPYIPNADQLNILGFNSLVSSQKITSDNILSNNTTPKDLFFALQENQKFNSTTKIPGQFITEGIQDIIVSPKSPISLNNIKIGTKKNIPQNEILTFNYLKPDANLEKGVFHMFKMNSYKIPDGGDFMRVWWNNYSNSGKNPNNSLPIEEFPILSNSLSSFVLPYIVIQDSEGIKKPLNFGQLELTNSIKVNKYWRASYPGDRGDQDHNSVSGKNINNTLNNSSIGQIIDTFKKNEDSGSNAFKAPYGFFPKPSPNFFAKFNNPDTQQDINFNQKVFNPKNYLEDNYILKFDEEKPDNFVFNLSGSSSDQKITFNWDLNTIFKDEHITNTTFIIKKIKDIIDKTGYIKNSLKIVLQPNFKFKLNIWQYFYLINKSESNQESIFNFVWSIKTLNIDISFQYELAIDNAFETSSLIFLTAITNELEGINWNPKEEINFKLLDTNNPNSRTKPYIEFFYLPWKIEKNPWEEDIWLDPKPAEVTTTSDNKEVVKSLDFNINNWLKPKLPNFDAEWIKIGAIKDTNYTTALFFTTQTNLLIGCRVVWGQTDNKEINSLFWKEIDLTPLNAIQNGDWISDSEIKSCQRTFEKNGQLFMYQGDKNNRIYYSDVNNFGYFPNSQYVDLEKMNQTDKIQNIIPFRNTSVIFTKKQIYIWKGTNAADWTFQQLNSAVGLVSPEAVVSFDNIIYFLGHRGFYGLKPGALNLNISGVQPIDNQIKNGISLNLVRLILDGKETCFGLTTQQQIYFFFPKTKLCMKFLPSQNAWSSEYSELFFGMKKVWLKDGNINFLSQMKNKNIIINNDLLASIALSLENDKNELITFQKTINGKLEESQFEIRYLDDIAQDSTNNTLNIKLTTKNFNINDFQVYMEIKDSFTSNDFYGAIKTAGWIPKKGEILATIVYTYEYKNQIVHYESATWNDSNFKDDFIDDGRDSANTYKYSVSIESPYYNVGSSFTAKSFMDTAFKFQMPNLTQSTRFSKIIIKDISEAFYQSLKELKIHLDVYIDNQKIAKTTNIQYKIIEDSDGKKSLQMVNEKDPYILSPAFVLDSLSTLGVGSFGNSIFAEAVAKLNNLQGRAIKFVMKIEAGDLVYFELVSMGIRYLQLITPFTNTSNTTK